MSRRNQIACSAKRDIQLCCLRPADQNAKPQSIAKSMQPPLCPGHREPSVIRTVKKGGENQGTACRTSSYTHLWSPAILCKQLAVLDHVLFQASSKNAYPACHCRCFEQRWQRHQKRCRTAILRVQPCRWSAAAWQMRLLPMGGTPHSAWQQCCERQQEIAQLRRLVRAGLVCVPNGECSSTMRSQSCAQLTTEQCGHRDLGQEHCGSSGLKPE